MSDRAVKAVMQQGLAALEDDYRECVLILRTPGGKEFATRVRLNLNGNRNPQLASERTLAFRAADLHRDFAWAEGKFWKP